MCTQDILLFILLIKVTKPKKPKGFNFNLKESKSDNVLHLQIVDK